MKQLKTWETLHKAIWQDLQASKAETEGKQGVVNYILANDLYLHNELCTKEAHQKLNKMLIDALNYM